MAKRSSNHSIDRFLLVTVLGWFYRDFYLFCGSAQAFRRWENSWTEAERARWSSRGIIHEAMLARAMNVCLQEADAALLSRSLQQDPADEAPAPRATETEEVRYRRLKMLMALQYAGAQERQALREQAARQEDVGIQRKTVNNLVRELLALEQRLQALPDPALADWLAARTQGFRLMRCAAGVPLYHIAPVGQPPQQMAAVQAAYYPFLDKPHTDQVLDLLGLTSERRQSLAEISEEKAAPLSGRWESGLAEQLEQALTAVETAWKAYGEAETADPQALFWYELTYHNWQWRDGALTLCPRGDAIPLLPWKVVYSNGYFYLCGLRLDLDPGVTGGAPGQKPVFSNLRLDRIRDLHRVRMAQSDVDYRPRELLDLVERMYGADTRGALEYRNASTIMYSGTPETLVIDCDAALMNSAVDDFGLENITLEESLPDGWVRIRVEGAVWGGAKQWLLQHGTHCRLAATGAQAARCRELAAELRAAAARYET